MHYPHRHSHRRHSRDYAQEPASSDQYSIPVPHPSSTLVPYFETSTALALVPAALPEPIYRSSAESQTSPTNPHDYPSSLYESEYRRTQRRHNTQYSSASGSFTSNDYTTERDAGRFRNRGYRHSPPGPRESYEFGGDFEDDNDNIAGSRCTSPTRMPWEMMNGGGAILHQERGSVLSIPRHMRHGGEYGYGSPMADVYSSSRPSIESENYGRSSGSTFMAREYSSSPPTTMFSTPELMGYDTPPAVYGEFQDSRHRREHRRENREDRCYAEGLEEDSRHRGRYRESHHRPAESRSRSSLRDLAGEIFHVGRRRYHR